MSIFLLINFVLVVYALLEISNLKKLIGENLKSKNQGESRVVTDANIPVNLSSSPIASEKIFEKNTDGDFITKFFSWMLVNWPIKLGSLLILIGFGWLIFYAFWANWIGPIGRVFFGLILGWLVISLGWYWLKKNIDQGVVLLGLGEGIVVISTWAGSRFYEMFTSNQMLLLIWGTNIALVYISYKIRQKSLSILVLLVGLIIPFLLPETIEIGKNIFLQGYLLVLVVGVLWISLITGWSELLLFCMLGVGFFQFPYFFSSEASLYRQMNLTQVQIFKLLTLTIASIFFTTQFLLIKKEAKANKTDRWSLMILTILIVGWLNGIVTKELRGLIAAIVGTIFAFEGWILSRYLTDSKKHLLYLGGAVVILTTAVFFQFKMETLWMVLSTQALILVVVSGLVFDKATAEKIAWFYLSPTFGAVQALSNYSFGGYFDRNSTLVIYGGDFWVVVYFGITTALGGWFLVNLKKETPSNSAKLLLMTSISTFLSLFWIWFPRFVGDFSIGRAILLGIYTVIGIVLQPISDLDQDFGWLKRYGKVLVGIVIVRLLLVEVWSLELGPRILAFLSVGVVLIISNLYSRKSKVLSKK